MTTFLGNVTIRKEEITVGRQCMPSLLHTKKGYHECLFQFLWQNTVSLLNLSRAQRALPKKLSALLDIDSLLQFIQSDIISVVPARDYSCLKQKDQCIHHLTR